MRFKLSESNNYRRVKHALFGNPASKIRTFAILSVENPLGWKNATDEEILQRYQQWLANPKQYNRDARKAAKVELVQDAIRQLGDKTVRYGGFNYANIRGSYGSVEHSMIVFNVEKDDAEEIARNYGQESFFFGKVYDDHVHIAYYETSNACKTYKLIEVTDKVSLEDSEDFFSQYGFKFRINLAQFGDEVTPIRNEGEFEESLDTHRTFMSRAMHRRRAYKE